MYFRDLVVLLLNLQGLDMLEKTGVARITIDLNLFHPPLPHRGSWSTDNLISRQTTMSRSGSTDAVLRRINEIILDPRYHDILAILKGARNGFV